MIKKGTVFDTISGRRYFVESVPNPNVGLISYVVVNVEDQYDFELISEEDLLKKYVPCLVQPGQHWENNRSKRRITVVSPGDSHSWVCQWDSGITSVMSETSIRYGHTLFVLPANKPPKGKSPCPGCGTPGAYVGWNTTVECINERCRFYAA